MYMCIYILSPVNLLQFSVAAWGDTYIHIWSILCNVWLSLAIVTYYLRSHSSHMYVSGLYFKPNSPLSQPTSTCPAFSLRPVLGYPRWFWMLGVWLIDWWIAMQWRWCTHMHACMSVSVGVAQPHILNVDWEFKYRKTKEKNKNMHLNRKHCVKL